MLKLANHNVCSLHLVAGTFGEIQIISSKECVAIDVQSRNYSSSSHVIRDHALANLSVETAARLRDLLDEAITYAASAALDSRQTALWSNASLTDSASRFSRKA